MAATATAAMIHLILDGSALSAPTSSSMELQAHETQSIHTSMHSQKHIGISSRPMNILPDSHCTYMTLQAKHISLWNLLFFVPPKESSRWPLHH